MATKNNPGAFDCYANAEDDEPMFVLLARDRTAPSIVREWVERRVEDARRGGKATDDAKLAEARACADAMERWGEAKPEASHKFQVALERVEVMRQSLRSAIIRRARELRDKSAGEPDLAPEWEALDDAIRAHDEWAVSQATEV